MENTLMKIVAWIWPVYVSRKKEYEHLLWDITEEQIKINVEKYNNL